MNTEPQIYNPNPHTLHPTLTPYTLHPAPCTLHPKPYTLNPTPYTLNPTPYTLQVWVCEENNGCAAQNDPFCFVYDEVPRPSREGTPQKGS